MLALELPLCAFVEAHDSVRGIFERARVVEAEDDESSDANREERPVTFPSQLRRALAATELVE